jgi:hypothetical protein
MSNTSQPVPERVLMTPARAQELLRRNVGNRPIRERYVSYLRRQIEEGRWRFNGASIVIGTDGAVIDGQHRLTAISLAQRSVELIIVYGVERPAFATIDTGQGRCFSDVLAINGVERYRPVMSSALAWLLRWNSGAIERYKEPQYKLSNADIEGALSDHPGMKVAIERAMPLRNLANPALIACFFYVLAERDLATAERMIRTLRDPERVPVDDPFFCLRRYFTTDHHKRKLPLVSCALIVKAANAAHGGKPCKTLTWRYQGKYAEKFPVLEF